MGPQLKIGRVIEILKHIQKYIADHDGEAVSDPLRWQYTAHGIRVTRRFQHDVLPSRATESALKRDTPVGQGIFTRYTIKTCRNLTHHNFAYLHR
jgi:hypothetical protein